MPRPQRENDGRRECVRAARNHAVTQLRAVWPCGGDLPPRPDHAFKQGLPAARRFALLVGIGLLEGVPDADGIVLARVHASVSEDLSETVFKELLRPRLSFVPVWVRDEFLC